MCTRYTKKLHPIFRPRDTRCASRDPSREPRWTTKTETTQPWPIVERFLKEQQDGAIGADVGCGNGKYLAVNPRVFMVGSDRSAFPASQLFIPSIHPNPTGAAPPTLSRSRANMHHIRQSLPIIFPSLIPMGALILPSPSPSSTTSPRQLGA